METLNQLIEKAEAQLEADAEFVREIAPMTVEQELAGLRKIESKERIRDNGMRPSDRVNTEKGAYAIALKRRIEMLEAKLSA